MRSTTSHLPAQSGPTRLIHQTPSNLRNRLGVFATLLLLAFLGLSAHAQTGEWTWVGGSNTVACDSNSTSFCTVPAVFGTLGTPATTNMPGGLYQAASWIDSAGNFWLFGGSGSWPDEVSGDPNPLVPDTLNDLWEFNPTTKEWTWMAGASTSWPCNPPSLGLQGCAYAGTYGVLGSAAAGNISGSRYNAVTWSDQNNNLWLFGGVASVQGPAGWSGDIFSTPLNDLWEVNPSTGEWGWMSGSQTIQVCSSGTGAYVCPLPGVYGSVGVAAAGQFPGARVLGATWTDSKGNLWMFGGAGWDGGNGGLTYGIPPPAAGSGLLNDLWQFNPNTLLWTWMGGAKLIGGTSGYDCVGVSGVYGQQGVPASGNWPGGREDAATWTDPSGNFWLFGGAGIVPSSENKCGNLNDLWEFNPSTDLWTWVSGTSATINPNGYTTPLGVYGSLAVPATTNVPGARTNAVTWVDPRGKLWLFGGNGVDSVGTTGNLNDLWRFDPVTTEWTWMGGSKTTPWGSNGNPGIYGTLGTAAPGNTPGGRTQASSWTDSAGNLWLFGGSGTANGAITFGSGGALLNDLWEYQPSPVSLTALSLPFGNQTLGTTSASQSVTMTNIGNAALPINSITVTGAGASSFPFTNTCGTSLAMGASCTIQGSFAPQAQGALSAAVTINDGAIGSPQSIALSGKGVEPPPTVSASSLSFATTTVGATSASQTVILTNPGTAVLSITSIAVTGVNASSFLFANSCGTSLAAGANCIIHGHFAPTTAGAMTAAVTITDNALDSPQSVALTGTGMTPAAVSLSATSLSFGNEAVGAASSSQIVTMTNTGTAALSINGIATTGANASSFVFGNSCGTSLAGGANCIIHGHFAPTATGALTAAITITDNAINSPQTIALSGTGVTPLVTLSVTSLAYGSVNVGLTSSSQTVTMTNSGTAALSIKSIAVTGTNASSFGFANNCGTSLAAGSSCTIHGHFAPTAAGAMTAAVTITDSAATSPQTISLTGTGIAPLVTLSAASLSFGAVTVGTTSASQSVTMTNTGTAALSITGIAVTGTDASSFVFANTCWTSLAAGASCTIHGHFAPTMTGALTAAITITDAATGSPQTIALTGTGQ